MMMIAGGIGLVLGTLFGFYMEGQRWARNAAAIQRIEWMGSLYKVVPAADWDAIAREGAVGAPWWGHRHPQSEPRP